MTRGRVAGKEGKGRGVDMSEQPIEELYKKWNRAAQRELKVRIQGPLLSFPGVIHYRIMDIGGWGCGRPCKGGLAQELPPERAYKGRLKLPTNPAEKVLPKYIGCVTKQFGKNPLWRQVDIPTQLVTHEIWHNPQIHTSYSPGLKWESVWAQYWFNRHDHLEPRPILRWNPLYWPPNLFPHRTLYIYDCLDRQNFGLPDHTVKQFLDLTASIKNGRVHDGIDHPREQLNTVKSDSTPPPLRP
jgi:hypothetical protein